jgi:site-specific recombinase XerD
MKNNFTGPLDSHINRYIAHKRSLGKQLVKVESILHLLDGFLSARGMLTLSQITPDHIDAFVASRQRKSVGSYNGLLGAVRGLFDWMVAHEILPESPLHCPSRRIITAFRPFLFSAEQVRHLLTLAGTLPNNPRALFRGETYKMIFTLLYALGLRVREVSRLLRKDVDFDAQILTIRETKFGKDRLVPFGPRMSHAIATFMHQEEMRFGPIPIDYPLFSFDKHKRKPISTNTISWTFHKLLPALELTVPSGTTPPHLHCLRHSFAVATLLGWYRAGVDPMSRLLDLSTFLGHVSPSSTAVYLTITAELLDSANERFARFAANSRKAGVR